MQFYLACLLAIVVVMATGSNAAKNGCTWSGCQHFTGSICSTGVTGASGRPIQKTSKKCELFGRKDFCCDNDCGHQECGWECGNLDMKSYSEVDPVPCSMTVAIPGRRTISIPTSSFFCCP